MTRRKYIPKTKLRKSASESEPKYSPQGEPLVDGERDEQPIPARLYPQFKGIMSELTNSDMSDAMWWHELERAAENFLVEHDLEGDPFDAVYQYINDVGQDATTTQ